MSLSATSPIRIATERNRARAIEMRIKGAIFTEIAEAIGVCKTRAFVLVKEGMEELRQETIGKAADLRDLELRRLDAMSRELWSKLSDPQAVNALRQISEARAKLLGLNAPAAIALGGILGQPIGVTEAAGWDLSKLTTEQLEQLEAIQRAAVAPAPVVLPASET